MARASLAVSGYTVEGNIERESTANPQVAFLQFRHELAAQRGYLRQRVGELAFQERYDKEDGKRTRDEAGKDTQGHHAVIQALIQLAQITSFEIAHQEIIFGRLQMTESQHTQDWGQSQRQEEAPPRAKA